MLMATGNPGKARELAELLAGVPYALVTLADVGLALDRVLEDHGWRAIVARRSSEAS